MKNNIYGKNFLGFTKKAMITKSRNKKAQYIVEQPEKLLSISPFTSKEFQKRKFSLLSELLSFLYSHNRIDGTFQHISNLILLSLITPETTFLDKIFSVRINYHFKNFYFKDHIVIIKKISSLLKQDVSITNKQLLKYCRLERFFIKICLKDYLNNSKLIF
ncbi:MAG: hypothetical protein ACFFAO_01470 [Candidatus Hermodarchaeota archaeon]